MAHKAGAKVRDLNAGPVVAQTFFWLDSPTEMFKTFIEANMRDGYTGSQAMSKDPAHDNGMPVEYQNYIAQLFEDELDYVVKEWRFWIGVTQPGALNQRAEKFAKGFPHSHGWHGLTAVHYVQVPEGGGALLVVDDKHNELHRFTPRVGLTAIIDGFSLHGVEAVVGDVPRYTLIATGFKGEQKHPQRGQR